MPTYLVPYVRSEWLRLWRSYNEDDDASKEAKKIGRDGSLGLTIEVKAKNAAEAARKVEADHPGHVAIVASISMLSK